MRTRLPLLLAVALLLPAAAAHAQGVVIGPDDQPTALELSRHHVEADVEERVAVVTVEHVFRNPTERTIEGTFLFPLPKQAQVSDFSMTVNGREMSGELLAADEARRIYERIVRQSLDPALLEMTGHRTFRARVFPIPPGEKRTLTLRYDATLPAEAETVTFTYPLRGALRARSAGRPAPLPRPRPHRRPEQRPDPPSHAADSSAITLHLAAQDGLKNIYSPSHEINVERPDDEHATVTLRNAGTRSGGDFVLYYSRDARDIGATLLAHRPYDDRPGYFTLMLAPPVEVEADQVQPRDIVLVLDTSGSMSGDKLAQAKEALRYILRRLGERDRFGVVAFSSDAELFRSELAAPERVSDALYFVDQLAARGGTNIDAALQRATSLLDGSSRGQIIFLTDGRPSVGETDPAQIRKHFTETSGDDLRLFPFGVGYDVNTRLLDGLARQTSTFASYISPDEHIEDRLARFYDKIRYPVMTNLTARLEGADVFKRVPRNVPDLYKGESLILTGRYRQPGSARLVLSGQLGEERVTRRYEMHFPEEERERDFVARLWATRRVGQLLESLRMNGENEELKQEIIALAEEFGLVTPYTSYLVREDERHAARRPPSPQQGQRFMQLESRAAADRASGEAAVRASKTAQALQQAEAAPEMPTTGMRRVQSRTFHLTADSAWVDAAFDAEKHDALRLQFASDAYFTFFRQYPEARAFTRLGRHVTFRFRDRFVRIAPEEGRTQMTPEALRRYFQ